MNKYAVLTAVTALTLACGAGSGYLAITYDNGMPLAVANYQEKLSTLFMTGASAILGLLTVWLTSGKK